MQVLNHLVKYRKPTDRLNTSLEENACAQRILPAIIKRQMVGKVNENLDKG